MCHISICCFVILFFVLQASLSAEQKSEVSSITGMGFPSPRVARALLRCKEDKSKVRQSHWLLMIIHPRISAIPHKKKKYIISFLMMYDATCM